MTTDHVLIFMKNTCLSLVGKFLLILFVYFQFFSVVLTNLGLGMVMLQVEDLCFGQLSHFVSDYKAWVGECSQKVECQGKHCKNRTKSKYQNKIRHL